jgi:hypothetical protein
LLVSGLPATGKSAFCEHLSAEHGYSHYDLEHFPEGWPCSDEWFPTLWQVSRHEFTTQLFRRHNQVVLDWGFPPYLVSWVREFQREGARLIWFDGEIATARRLYQERGGGTVDDFDLQLNRIDGMGLPGIIRPKVVGAYTPAGHCRAVDDPHRICVELGISRRKIRPASQKKQTGKGGV